MLPIPDRCEARTGQREANGQSSVISCQQDCGTPFG
jgi:hypothetical protein